MAFAILRTSKLKTMGNIGGSLAHNYRTIETPNADHLKTPDNFHSLSNPEAVKMQFLSDYLKKDVLMLLSVSNI